MRYSDFIKQTISNENGIDWNYYKTGMPIENILQANRSGIFIRKYFESGGKELPLLLNPTEATNFINTYFAAGCKENTLSFDFSEMYLLPDDRAIHTVSGFFLGLLIESCLNGTRTLAIESSNQFPFAYLWFLMFLYHDYGYCVTERDNSPISTPERAPIPDMLFTWNPLRIHRKEYDALCRMKRELGIDLSLFSPYPGSLNRVGNFRQNNEINLQRALLRELTQRTFTVTGRPRLRFNTGTEITGHQYTSIITTRYFNYCINERHKVDHGIVGGYLFYDRMVKNYLSAYMTVLYEREALCVLGDFHYRDRHFCQEQLPIFSYIADCISAHNIWKQPEEVRAAYEQYKLDVLLAENFKNITFQENPLLYILVVADSLEPTKVYGGLPPQKVSDAIDIEYLPAHHVLTFSSRNSEVSIEILYRKAKGLEDWTSVRCSELNEGKFTLRI